MRSFILSQCRDFRTGVMWENFGVLVTARAREIWMFWSFSNLRLWKIIVQWVAVVKFRMNDRSGDGTGNFEVKIRTNTLTLKTFAAMSIHNVNICGMFHWSSSIVWCRDNASASGVNGRSDSSPTTRKHDW